MNTDISDKLRAGIASIPAQVPPGLARSAYRRYSRRRVTARAATAAGTAAAAGIAASVFLPRSAQPATETTAYVVSHVAQVLDALPSDTMLVDQSTGTGPGFQPMDRWGIRGRTRIEAFTRAGQPVYAMGTSITPTTTNTVLVDYQNKTWWRTVGLDQDNKVTGPVPPIKLTCKNTNPGETIGNAADMVDLLRTEVACGELKADGTGTINGVTVVKLAGKVVTYWVNSTTYLPVRRTVTQGPGAVIQDDFQWLPPTAANLAELNTSVPPGFTQVRPDPYLP
jgi:hypothetical protein